MPDYFAVYKSHDCHTENWIISGWNRQRQMKQLVRNVGSLHLSFPQPTDQDHKIPNLKALNQVPSCLSLVRIGS